ncbi:hypothetical protein OROMI_002392 [Orobanche minor]
MMDAARKRAQRRAIYLAKRRGDPQQSIQAVGSRCRIHRDDSLYQATENQQGLVRILLEFTSFKLKEQTEKQGKANRVYLYGEDDDDDCCRIGESAQMSEKNTGIITRIHVGRNISHNELISVL